MKKHNNRKNVSWLFIVLIICIVGSLLNGCAGKGLDSFLRWAFRPVSLSYSSDAETDIEKYLGIQIPSSARFREGWVDSGKDSTYFYCFELDLREDCSGEFVDAWFRDTLGLGEEQYSKTYSLEERRGTFQSTAEGYGYTFTEAIDYKDREFSEIYYSVMDDMIVFACIYGI